MLFHRIGLISELIQSAPSGFGRTALMKCLYLLQTVRGVPLGYHFRLYTYGPFDPDVLSDLSLAERLEAVKSELIRFSGGHRYQLGRGPTARQMGERVRDFIGRYRGDIDWVMERFGGRTAVELEMISTIVFAARSVVSKGDEISIGELARKVREVKPRLVLENIEEEALKLRNQGLITAS
jgi:hypothetical protein